MKDFDWTQFTRKIPIAVSIETLYNAWATPEELKKWFLSEASFRSKEGTSLLKKEKISAGQTYTWQWHLWDGTETGEVLKANGTDHIEFSFAGSCKVSVTFKTYEKGTIVSLTQNNIPIDDKSKKDIRLGCDSGWSFYLLNLKSVYEGGLDLRNKDKSIGPMLNN